MFRGGVDISKTITGAAQPQITRTNLAPIQISFPPIDEQKRMVAILDEVFEAIDKAKQNAEKNLQNARELFESYLQNIFANPGFDSAKKRVDEVSHLVDSLHKTPEYTTDGFPMVRVTDIKPGILNYSKAKRVSRETFEEFSKRHKPREGDIVFARVGSFGVSSIVGSNDAFCLGQNTVFIVPSINPHYLYYFLNTSDAREQINNLVAGTTQGTISLKSIKEILLPVVEESNQSLIVNRINEVSAQTNKLGPF
jgi:type I restriction enzyme S subunit